VSPPERGAQTARGTGSWSTRKEVGHGEGHWEKGQWQGGERSKAGAWGKTGVRVCCYLFSEARKRPERRTFGQVEHPQRPLDVFFLELILDRAQIGRLSPPEIDLGQGARVLRAVGGRGAGGWLSVGKEADGRRLWGAGAQAGALVLGRKQMGGGCGGKGRRRMG
jgi:hypothetical protein